MATLLDPYRTGDPCLSVENPLAQRRPGPHHLGSLPQLRALGLDRAKQTLPRFIEGLGALRLQVGRQLFEIDSRFSKIVQNSFAVSSVARKSSG